MPADPRASGFFEPIGMSTAPGAGMIPVGVPNSLTRPRTYINPRLTYKNTYGTDVGVGYDVDANTIQGNATIPIGDATSGNQLILRGGYDVNNRAPEAFIGFRKLNLPQVSTFEASSRAAQADPGLTQYFERDPAALKRYQEFLQREAAKKVLGIEQVGTPKYEVGLDVFNNQNQPRPSGLDFARGYANELPLPDLDEQQTIPTAVRNMR